MAPPTRSNDLARIDEDRRQAEPPVSEEEIQATAEHLAQQFPDLHAIWLFHPYAEEERRRTNEIGLAVLTERWVREDGRLREQLTAVATEFLGITVAVEPLGDYLTPERTFEILGLPKLLTARDTENAAIFASTLRSYARGELEWREARLRR
jgi:hypothetical protein